jgi:hypothetical protein
MVATSCVDENNISHKSTALLGVGQIFYYCSPVNYNLLLTDAEETAELLEAMIGFIGLIKRLFPQNKERDQVISTVNYWRLRLISIITEHIDE